jgi:DMSO/TMAO reductase YedYZ molybdopterin-dependent catalytic subunit
LAYVTARATDWGLAFLVGLLFASGVLTLFAGAPGDVWVFAVHGAGGFALGAVLSWKLRRVWPRVVRPERWDRHTGAGLAALSLVVATLVSGVGWSSGADVQAAGYGLLNWHFALGAVLTLTVGTHLVLRAKPIRRRDLAGRRQFLQAGAVAAGAYAVWWAQRPVSAWVGLRGAKRRFTGSYEAGSFAGNDFPATSWVADHPRPLSANHRLEVVGEVDRPLRLRPADLDAGDELVATLDCTGGFYSRQHWRGVRIGRLLDRAGAKGAGTHLRVISHTGYRWSFDTADAREFLLAVAVGGQPLSHEHGAPVRLVAPGRRGFQWVKWVERIELHEHPDDLAPASTVWSSFTAAGRGA